MCVGLESLEVSWTENKSSSDLDTAGGETTQVCRSVVGRRAPNTLKILVCSLSRLFASSAVMQSTDKIGATSETLRVVEMSTRVLGTLHYMTVSKVAITTKTLVTIVLTVVTGERLGSVCVHCL
jgi:hypothetical protein